MRSVVRPARFVLALSLLLLGVGVPASVAAPFSYSRISLGTVSAPMTRTYVVPNGAVLAGVTWASGTLAVSARPALGTFTPLDNDSALGGRPGTEPYWLDPSVRALTLRFDGHASGVRVDFVGAGSPASKGSSSTQTISVPRLGSVVSRAGWGADERWRSGSVSYTTPKALVVHHTVTRNDYTASEAPGLIRAVYAYHTKSRGWSDIGYNLIVDRFGTVYEGRYGGFQRGVVGTHTAGFNTEALGISLLGNFDEVSVPDATVDTVARAGAWFATRFGVDPRSRVTLTSAGSPRFARGARVTVYRMPGHRDLGSTACPGRYAYERLAAIRATAWRKLRAVYAKPEVTGAPVQAPDPVTVSASLDHAARWRATITTEDGTEVLATQHSYGTRASVTWNGVFANGLPALPYMHFRYELTADDGVHGASDPVSGTFDGGVPRIA
jgi:hypothetical protein